MLAALDPVQPFSMEKFVSKVVKLFTSDLIQEITSSFAIPEHLAGFTALDPQKLSRDQDELKCVGTDLIGKLCNFYGEPYL